jgi:phospholipid/cholesterol/gamma-HCH transport system substrate-binding protein
VTNGQAAQPVMKVPRRFQGRLGVVRAGLIALILVIVATFLAFSKQLPWEQAFEVKAVFQSANNIRLDSPVRIAGVEVGRVTKVESMDGSNSAVVTMKIEDSGLPIHKDATLKIRPRLFLEGNFFVDMRPGTPEAAEFEDGDTIPLTQTSYPVQLDQILTSLQSDTRKNLQDLLGGLGTSLTHEPTAAEDIGQDPDVQGEQASKALNDSLSHGGDAFKHGTQVNQGLLGTERHDLSKLIAGLQKVFAALDQNEEQLKDFFTNFNTTMAALASEQDNLRVAVRRLEPTIEKAHSALGHFSDALPPTREFVRGLTGGVRETHATIEAAGPWLTQFTALVSKPELGGLLEDLRPMTESFAQFVARSIEFQRQVDLSSRCFADVFLPSGDQVIQDGPATTGAPSWKEFWYTVVGLTGESQNFDGNGQYTRVETGGGENIVKSTRLPNRPPVDATLFGNTIVPPLGTRPTRPAKQPAYKPKATCYKNKRPNLNGPAAAAGPPDAVIGKQP